MCLVTKSRLREASKNIVVYKVFKYYTTDKKKMLFTYYLSVPMEIGKTYTEKCAFKGNEKNVSRGMYHSFTELESAVQLRNLFLENERQYLKQDSVVVKCIIPKGAKYFLGNDGDIASSSITLKEIMDYSEIKKVKLYSIKEKTTGWIWRHSLKENEIEMNIKVLTNMIFPTVRREILEIIEQTPIE